MKRTKYIVYLRGEHIARFSDYSHAITFARFMSRNDWGIYGGPGFVEVSAPDGIIAQFRDGGATPEFAHLDKRQ